MARDRTPIRCACFAIAPALCASNQSARSRLMRPSSANAGRDGNPSITKDGLINVAEHEPCIGQSDHWYTPRTIFDALGLTFDLDPCSPGPGHWVPARRIYTQADDGLHQPWDGLVFMNPPFGGRNG